MKRRVLIYYDKFIIAAIMSVLALTGCARKNYIPKNQKRAEFKRETKDPQDTIRVPRNRFDDEVIVMYGVPPVRDIE